MNLASGSRLGPYEIVAPIGAGGMGEVYRARDTRLDRAVAVKILPAEFARDAQRKARFEREAKTISQLSHPNICALFDVGDNYLVMELLDGETLGDRISRGPLPLPEVLKYGAQIADALGKAHREGVVHRDLKPGNVMLTKGGAKLLDFGLAKSGGHQPAVVDATEAKPLTKEGTIVGTFQYMAPEQLAGEQPDARSDIFALGAVLYEMATGKRAFEGKSKTSLIAAIMSGEPKPMSEMQPLTPGALEHVVKKCLAKDPDERWQNATDIGQELRWISEAGSQAGSTRGSPRAIFGMIAFVGVVIIAALAVLLHFNRRTAPSPLRRYTITLPQNAPAEGALALSNDGRRLVYKSSAAAPLYLRKMDTGEVTPIAGTENGDFPFFSPDGEWIGFYSAADGAIKKVALSGGSPITIDKIPQAIRGAIWWENSILFASAGKRFAQVPASGGAAQPLGTYDPKETEGERWPTLLPDGRHLLYTINDYSGNYERAKIAVLSLSDQTSRILLEGGTFPRYCCGHLVYSHSGGLFAVPFDADALKITGAPIPVADEVGGFDLIGLAYADVASDGTLVYAPRNSLAEQRELVWIDRKGAATRISAVRRNYQRLALSPDGAQLAVVVVEHGRSDLWLYEFGRDLWRRLTTGDNVLSLAWAPDSSQIFFSSGRSGLQDIYRMPIDGSAPAREVTRDKANWQMPLSVSPDNRYVLVMRQQHPFRFLLLDLQHPDRMERLVPSAGSAGDQLGAAFSPDGQWFAFVSNESGQYEVYLSRFPDAGRKWLVSNGGGNSPIWRPDGRELYYANGKKLMAVEMSPPLIGKARVLFENELEVADIASNGQRLVGIRSEKVPPTTQLNVITGLFDNLQSLQRRPGGN